MEQITKHVEGQFTRSGLAPQLHDEDLNFIINYGVKYRMGR